MTTDTKTMSPAAQGRRSRAMRERPILFSAPMVRAIRPEDGA